MLRIVSKAKTGLTNTFQAIALALLADVVVPIASFMTHPTTVANLSSPRACCYIRIVHNPGSRLYGSIQESCPHGSQLDSLNHRHSTCWLKRLGKRLVKERAGGLACVILYISGTWSHLRWSNNFHNALPNSNRTMATNRTTLTGQTFAISCPPISVMPVRRFIDSYYLLSILGEISPQFGVHLGCPFITALVDPFVTPLVCPFGFPLVLLSPVETNLPCSSKRLTSPVHNAL